MDFWLQQGLIVRVNGPDGGREFQVERPFARVGSHPSSEVLLPDIAKRSIYLHATSDGVFCLNLSRDNQFPPEHAGQWLKPDEQLSLGPYRLTASLESHPLEPAAPLLPLIARGRIGNAVPVFRVSCKNGPKAKYRIQRLLTVVGRDVTCGLSLSGSRVSSPHCAFYYENERLWCIDLLSGNGTFHNGQRTDIAELELSDQVGVGEFRLVYKARAKREAASQAGASTSENAGEIGASICNDVDENATVRLGRGDTVNLPPESSGGTGQRMPQEPPVSAESHAAELNRDSPNVATAGQNLSIEAMSAIVIPDAEQVQESPPARPPLPSSTVAAKLEEQETRLQEICGAFEAAQQAWRVDKEHLAQRLIEQAAVIERLERELTRIRAALAEGGDRTTDRTDFDSIGSDSDFTRPPR